MAIKSIEKVHQALSDRDMCVQAIESIYPLVLGSDDKCFDINSKRIATGKYQSISIRVLVPVE